MNKSTLIGSVGGALAGAVIAFPVGLAVAGEVQPERVVDTREVLPAACGQVLDGVSEYLSISSDALRAAADYPLIIAELAPAAAYGDNATLRELTDRMKGNESDLLELIDRQARLDLSAALDECSAYR